MINARRCFLPTRGGIACAGGSCWTFTQRHYSPIRFDNRDGGPDEAPITEGPTLSSCVKPYIPVYVYVALSPFPSQKSLTSSIDTIFDNLDIANISLVTMSQQQRYLKPGHYSQRQRVVKDYTGVCVRCVYTVHMPRTALSKAWKRGILPIYVGGNFKS